MSEKVTQKTEIPWGEIGYITYKRTYSRKLKENSEEKEEFHDTVARVIKGCQSQLKVGFTEEETTRLEEILLSLKGSVAGRFLWQLGTKTVTDLGLLSLQNCAFVTVDHPIRPFTWAMDALMLGSGVGYNIQREYVYQIPKLKKKKVKIERFDSHGADYIVPDTRTGWVKLLGKVLKSYFYSGEGFTYSTKSIRGKGTPIKGFGGVASGPEDLVEGITNICKVLDNRRGKKLRPIDCLDVMNLIGTIVVAGNVRRSAQIAIGDMDDFQFLNAKRFDLGNVPNWRSLSNNSVVCNDFSELPEQFWHGYENEGEAYGLINLKSARSMGRRGETQYPDINIAGFNPCAEQGLEPYETCCLSEIFLPNIESQEELLEVASYLYRINKHSLSLKCHHEETEEVVHKNMRMGIGITGYCMSSEEQKTWLSDAYEKLREYDREYSEKHGFPISIKLTTIKPSGTLSLLPGVTPGGHPGYSLYHIRRMRIASDSPLVEMCRQKGYKVEYEEKFDGTKNYNLAVVEFPCKFPEGTIVAKDVTAVEQLEIVKRLQTEWSDNSVSITIYFKREELNDIKEWLSENYNECLKTVSFLPFKDHAFKQMPLEEITKEQYEEMIANTTPINSVEVDETDISEEQIGCEGGACPIK